MMNFTNLLPLLLPLLCCCFGNVGPFATATLVVTNNGGKVGGGIRGGSTRKLQDDEDEENTTVVVDVVQVEIDVEIEVDDEENVGGLLLVGAPCAISSDCVDGTYCGSNLRCLAIGSCTIDADCFRPQNYALSTGSMGGTPALFCADPTIAPTWRCWGVSCQRYCAEEDSRSDSDDEDEVSSPSESVDEDSEEEEGSLSASEDEDSEEEDGSISDSEDEDDEKSLSASEDAEDDGSLSASEDAEDDSSLSESVDADDDGSLSESEDEDDDGSPSESEDEDDDGSPSESVDEDDDDDDDGSRSDSEDINVDGSADSVVINEDGSPDSVDINVDGSSDIVVINDDGSPDSVDINVDGSSDIVVINEDGSSKLRACTTQTDCLEETEYCAQGLCLSSGSCMTDTDCWNPNHRFDDKRCTGYLTCTDAGTCDRICGSPCPNPTTQSCAVTGCDDDLNMLLCEEAVACYPDRCSDDCAGLYFDAAGSVMTNCTSFGFSGSVDDDDDGMNTTTPEGIDDDDYNGVKNVTTPFGIELGDIFDAIAAEKADGDTAAPTPVPPTSTPTATTTSVPPTTTTTAEVSAEEEEGGATTVIVEVEDLTEVVVVVPVKQNSNPYSSSFCTSMNDSCTTCLDEACVWVPPGNGYFMDGTSGCVDSCFFIADKTSCYATRYFTENTVEEICRMAATTVVSVVCNDFEVECDDTLQALGVNCALLSCVECTPLLVDAGVDCAVNPVTTLRPESNAPTSPTTTIIASPTPSPITTATDEDIAGVAVEEEVIVVEEVDLEVVMVIEEVDTGVVPDVVVEEEKGAECSVYEACAGLDGACCPDEEGEFLSCCSEEPSPASAECSAFEACAELEGACCPDKEGEFLSCCSEEVPPASAECSAYEACAGLDGACCPDKEGEFLSCCSDESPPAPDEVEVDVVVVVEEDAPITPSFNITAAYDFIGESGPACAAYTMCENLVENCCPTEKGVMLDCCYGNPPDPVV